MRVLFCFLLSLFLCACGAKKEEMTGPVLRVGTLCGADAQLMQVIQNVAKEKYGLNIKIIEYYKYGEPNHALMKGEIDVNMFQHQPYLFAWNAMNHGDLIAAYKTFVFPMGIYSYKVDNIRELKRNAVIAIPHDPTNEARALMLLQRAGLITLKSGADVLAAPKDIDENPLNLQIKLVDAAELTQILPEVAAAVITGNFAIIGGLMPKRGDLTPTRKDAIYLEDKAAMYANVFAIRPQEKGDPRIQALIGAFNSTQVVLAAQSFYHGAAVKCTDNDK